MDVYPCKYFTDNFGLHSKHFFYSKKKTCISERMRPPPPPLSGRVREESKFFNVACSFSKNVLPFFCYNILFLFCFIILLREAAKKVLFLMAGPYHPPSPQGLMAVGTFFFSSSKSYNFFFPYWPSLSPTPPLHWPSH